MPQQHTELEGVETTLFDVNIDRPGPAPGECGALGEFVSVTSTPDVLVARQMVKALHIDGSAHTISLDLLVYHPKDEKYADTEKRIADGLRVVVGPNSRVYHPQGLASLPGRRTNVDDYAE